MKAVRDPPSLWDFSIPRTALRKKKFCKRLLMLRISVKHWNCCPYPTQTWVPPACSPFHNKTNWFTAHRKQTGLSAGLEMINLNNSPAAKTLTGLVFLSNLFYTSCYSPTPSSWVLRGWLLPALLLLGSCWTGSGFSLSISSPTARLYSSLSLHVWLPDCPWPL